MKRTLWRAAAAAAPAHKIFECEGLTIRGALLLATALAHRRWRWTAMHFLVIGVEYERSRNVRLLQLPRLQLENARLQLPRLRLQLSTDVVYQRRSRYTRGFAFSARLVMDALRRSGVAWVRASTSSLRFRRCADTRIATHIARISGSLTRRRRRVRRAACPQQRTGSCACGPYVLKCISALFRSERPVQRNDSRDESCGARLDVFDVLAAP